MRFSSNTWPLIRNAVPRIIALDRAVPNAKVRLATISSVLMNGYSRVGTGRDVGIAIGLGEPETTKLASANCGLGAGFSLCASDTKVLEINFIGARIRSSARFAGP